MDVTVSVLGLQGVEDALAGAGAALAKRTLRAGLRAGAEVVLAAVLPKVPVLKEGTPQREPGELRDSMTVKYKLSASEQSGYAIVGPQYKKADGDQSPGRYGLFVEFGSIHGPAQAYMRPGWDESQRAALEAFTKVMAEGVESLKKP